MNVGQEAVRQQLAELTCGYCEAGPEARLAFVLMRARSARDDRAIERIMCYEHQESGRQEIESMEGIDHSNIERLRILRFLGICITWEIAANGMRDVNEAMRLLWDPLCPPFLDHCKRLPKHMKALKSPLIHPYSLVVCSKEMGRDFLRDVRDEYFRKGSGHVIVRYVPM